MKILTDLFSETAINALGWSIFHIIWQGFILAILLGIILRLLYHKSAQIRYYISLASLLFVVGLSIFNFYNNYDPNIDGTEHVINQNLATDQNEVKVIDFKGNKHNLNYSSIISRINQEIEKIDRFFPIVVNIWLIGVFFFIVKFIISFLYTNRLRKSKSQQISNEWLTRFNKLEKQLNIQKAIRYIESKLIKVPFVLGYFKPIVVVPFEMLSGIPSNQIEAIIAHELAHIRRNDYIINVIQTIIETMFFFHPAVWFISSKIRDERENCCDDVAITVCDDSLIYAKALVSVQELSLGKYYSAVAFSGNKNHLLNRIKRMIMKPKIKYNITDKIISAILIISAVTALSFTYTAENNDLVEKMNFPTRIEKPAKVDKPDEPERIENFVIDPPSEVTVPSEPSPVKSVFSDTMRIHKHNHESIEIDNQTIVRTFKENGKKTEMKFTLKDGKATNLYVDGVKIPESDYKKYQAKIDESIEDLKNAKDDIRKAMKDIEEIDYEQIRRDVEEAMKDVHIDMAKVQEDIARSMEEAKNIDIDQIMKEVELNLEKIKSIDMDKYRKEMQESMEEFQKIDMEKVRMEMEELRQSILENIDMEQIQQQMEETRKELEQSKNQILSDSDMEKIQEEMKKVQEKLSQMNMNEIRIQMEENLKYFDEEHKQETLKEMESKLQELENLELEEK